MLTVITASTSNNLTTLDALKSHLGTTSTAYDEQLEDAIVAASDTVATYMGYYPLRQTYRETLAGYGGQQVMVSRTPLTSVSAMYYGSTGLLVDPTGYWIENAEAGFIVRDLGFPWSAGVEWDLDAHIAPRTERKVFIVDYTAGWVMSTGSTRTLPADIEHAAVEAAKSLFLGRRRDGAISSKSVGALSVTYGSAPSGAAYAIPEESRGFLERYRRIK
jgi:hypothetical protein